MGTRYEELMEAARETNRQMRHSDIRNGFAPPDKCPLSVHLRTAMAAIECGINIDDWECVSEGQAMLEQLAERFTQPDDYPPYGAGGDR